MEKIIFITGSGKKKYFGKLSSCISEASLLDKKDLPRMSVSMLRASLKELNKNEWEYICDYFIKIKARKYQSDHPVLWRIYCKVIYLRALIYYSRYRHFLMETDASWIGLWGGCYHDDRAAEVAATKLGKKVVFFEGGLLPNTTTVDGKGVNLKNSVPREKEFYEQYKSEVAGDVLQHLVPRAPVKNRSLKSIVLPERYVFVPFQLDTDSQIVLYGDWIDSMRTLFSVIQSISEATSKNITFVFKEHPSSPAVYDDLLGRLNHNTLFANGNSTEELIKNAEAVITVNSTVGIESLMFGKRVITLGRAFYSISELVKEAHSEKELVSILNNLDSWSIDHRLVRNFILYLREEYLVSGSWKNPSEEHAKRVSNKLESLMAG
jgi:capsular polysaccharide export protein